MSKDKGEKQTKTYQFYSIFGLDNSKALIPPQVSIQDCLEIARAFGWLFQDKEKQISWLLWDYHIWPTNNKGEHIGYE